MENSVSDLRIQLENEHHREQPDGDWTNAGMNTDGSFPPNSASSSGFDAPLLDSWCVPAALTLPSGGERGSEWSSVAVEPTLTHFAQPGVRAVFSPTQMENAMPSGFEFVAPSLLGVYPSLDLLSYQPLDQDIPFLEELYGPPMQEPYEPLSLFSEVQRAPEQNGSEGTHGAQILDSGSWQANDTLSSAISTGVWATADPFLTLPYNCLSEHSSDPAMREEIVQDRQVPPQGVEGPNTASDRYLATTNLALNVTQLPTPVASCHGVKRKLQKYDDRQREQIKQVRRQGACLRCRIYKEKVRFIHSYTLLSLAAPLTYEVRSSCSLREMQRSSGYGQAV